jgi:hypothetical protein
VDEDPGRQGPEREDEDMLTALLTATALMLAPAATAEPTRGSDSVAGVVWGKNYMRSTPEGPLRMPTGPPCYHLDIANSGVFREQVCVSRAAYHSTSIGSYYDGPIERRL